MWEVKFTKHFAIGFQWHTSSCCYHHWEITCAILCSCMPMPKWRHEHSLDIIIRYFLVRNNLTAMYGFLILKLQHVKIGIGIILHLTSLYHVWFYLFSTRSSSWSTQQWTMMKLQKNISGVICGCTSTSNWEFTDSQSRYNKPVKCLNSIEYSILVFLGIVGKPGGI